MVVHASGRLLGEHLPSLSDHTFSDPAVLVIAFDRIFDAPVAEIWRWLVDPELTAQWYGPGLRAGALGALKIPPHGGIGAGALDGQVVELEPGRLLRLQFREGKYTWFVSATFDSDTTRDGPRTTLTCVQSFGSAEFLERIGPSWDYFLDRLVIAQAGGDPDVLNFDPDYFPGLVPQYRALIREAITSSHDSQEKQSVNHAHDPRDISDSD